MAENENIIVNTASENEEDASQPVDTIFLDKIYIKYPDGTIKLKTINIPWDIK